ANAPLDLFGNPIPQARSAVFQATTVEVVPQPAPALTHELSNAATTPHEYILVQDEAAAKELVVQMLQQQEIALDTETTDVDANKADILGMSVCWEKGKAYYVAIPAGKEEAKQFMELFRPV